MIFSISVLVLITLVFLIMLKFSGYDTDLKAKFTGESMLHAWDHRENLASKL